MISASHTIKCINKNCGWSIRDTQKNTDGIKCPKCNLPTSQHFNQEVDSDGFYTLYESGPSLRTQLHEIVMGGLEKRFEESVNESRDKE